MAEAGKNFYRYNAKQVFINIKGEDITGLGEEMWSFAKEQALGEVTEGAQGDSVYNVTNSSLYKATVTVQQSSPDVDFLFSLANETEPFELYMTDNGLKRKEGGAKALLAEMPEDTRGKTLEDISFVFYVFDGAVTNI